MSIQEFLMPLNRPGNGGEYPLENPDHFREISWKAIEIFTEPPWKTQEIWQKSPRKELHLTVGHSNTMVASSHFAQKLKGKGAMFLTSERA